MVSGTSQKWCIARFITSSLFQPLHNIHRGVRMSQEQVWALNYPWKVIYVQKRAKKHDFEPFWDPPKKTYWFVLAISTLVLNMMSIWDLYTAKKGPEATLRANNKWKSQKTTPRDLPDQILLGSVNRRGPPGSSPDLKIATKSRKINCFHNPLDNFLVTAWPPRSRKS